MANRARYGPCLNLFKDLSMGYTWAYLPLTELLVENIEKAKDGDGQMVKLPVKSNQVFK